MKRVEQSGLCRQMDTKGSSQPRRALDLDRPAEPLADPVDQVEAEAEPPAVGTAIATLEDPGQVLRRNADSRVMHEQQGRRQAHLYRAILRIVHGVEQQIVDDAGDHHRRAGYGHWLDVDVERERLGGRAIKIWSLLESRNNGGNT